MIKELNNKSLVYGIPGFLIQAIGLFVNPLISLIGSILLIIGLSYYAKAKGHSRWFGLFGLLSWIGIIVLLVLKDRHITPEEVETRKKTTPKKVILGILLGLGLLVGVPLIIAILYRKEVPMEFLMEFLKQSFEGILPLILIVAIPTIAVMLYRFIRRKTKK